MIFQEEFPYQNQLLNNPQYLLTITILQTIVAAVFFAITLIISSKYRKTQVRSTLDLALTMLFLGCSFIAATFPQILALTNPHLFIINGVPIYGEYAFWWTNISFMFASVSNVFLIKFMLYLFKNLKEWLSKVFNFLIIVFNIWNFYQGTFNRATGSLPTEMAILFLLIGFIPWFILSVLSIKLFIQVDRSVYRTGVFMIFLSAVCTVISFVIYVIYQLNLVSGDARYNFEKSYFIFYICTAVLFYIGYWRIS